jgi:CRP/FNR family transcriptional regulator, cyclic AMP receptor protein
LIPKPLPWQRNPTSSEDSMETLTAPKFPAHDVLKGVDLFTALEDHELNRLASITRSRPCAKGETLMVQNDHAGDHLYVVAEGEVAVTVEGTDGKETILAMLKRGDFFGEMSLLDGSPRAATIRTTEVTRLVTIRREDFQKLLHNHPNIAWTLLGEISNRLRQSNRKVACLAHQRVERRVAAAMWQLFEDSGVRLRDEDGKRCLILRHRPTQQHIAEMAGTSRETVSRLMTAWERKGIIRDHERDLFLLSEAELRGMI